MPALKPSAVNAFANRVDCDVDYDDLYAGWMTDVKENIPAGSATAGAGAAVVEEEDAEPEFSKKNPFSAPIVENYNLNGDDSSKETRHVSISLKGSGLSYEAGDALGIVPVEQQTALSRHFGSAKISPDAPVGDSNALEVMQNEYDITNLSKKFLTAYAEKSGSAELATLIEDAEKLSEYTWGRFVIDVLEQYPTEFTSAEDLFAILAKLNPRLYSISSSPKAHPDEVHVTVGAVRYEAYGRNAVGVCSTLPRRGSDDRQRS